MDIKNVCIAIRGELLRSVNSGFFKNKKTKNLLQCDLSEKSFSRQNDIMKSIINYIIIPYQKQGYNVFVSGCIYNCPNYNEKLMYFFPKNTIKQIKSGETNQAQMYYLSLLNAEVNHPNCIEYISIRADYIMLKNIVINSIRDLHRLNGNYYVGFAWENLNIPNVDVFFIIAKKAMYTFTKILLFENDKNYTDTHYILENLKKENLILYPIWCNYNNGRTGISYNDYINNIELHKNRPFVNYMRDR